MSARAERFPLRYVSAAGGGALHELGTELVAAADLRKRAATIEAIEKAARGGAVVGADADHGLVEFQRLAKNLTRSSTPYVLSALDAPGVAAALERGGAHVWRVRGAEGNVFASKGAPPYAPEIEPVSAHKDFAREKTHALKLLRKDAAPAADPADVMPDKQIVYGVVLEPETVDSQGDIYSATEIESACHLYLEHFQDIHHMHMTALSEDSVRIVESYIAPCDFVMGTEPVKTGTWVLALHVLNDELWAQIKDGRLTGLSIGGMAQRVSVADPEAIEAAQRART